MDIKEYPRTARLVNRFKIGADPEFIFEDTAGRYMYAENLGLTTLRGFGCDMSGRQAEIRAYPSRFALEVVAGIVDSLRWMATAHPFTGAYNWVAKAYNGKDSCGGHMHFGRRTAKTAQDIKVLDEVTRYLVGSNILNCNSFHLRQEYGHNYGAMGDFRQAAHGYEYRTLPTEMANPWLAYFTLVFAKLSVYEGCASLLSLAALLQKYRDIDDDAAIVLKALAIHGLPKDSTEDFKCTWGVAVCEQALVGFRGSSLENDYYPSIIKPEEQTCQELFMYLTEGYALPKRHPKVTWDPYNLPLTVHPVTVQPHALGHLHDVGMDLLCYKESVYLQYTDRPYLTFNPGKHSCLPSQEIKQAFKKTLGQVRIKEGNGETLYIGVPKDIKDSKEKCKVLKDLLSNTELFPICKAKDYRSVNWGQWDNLSLISPSKPLLGKVITELKRKEITVKETETQPSSLIYKTYDLPWEHQAKLVPKVLKPRKRVRRRID